MTTTTTYNVAPLVEHFADHVAVELGIVIVVAGVIACLAAYLWAKRPKWMP